MSEAGERLALFRERRNLGAIQPQGPLALVNTQWVDMEQTIWGVPGTWAPAPQGVQALMLTAPGSEGISVDGIPVDGTVEVRSKGSDQPSEVIFGDTQKGHVIAQGDSYAFDYAPEWVITGAWKEIPGGKSVGFEHLKDEGVSRDEVIPGEITFTHEGTEYSIAAFKAGTALQLVFADATNDVSTYSVGRFLFLAPNPDGTIPLDFNYAVLPPCAFSYAFNCPLPPAQNRFPFAIEAGEKNVLKKDGSLLHG